MLFFVIMNKWGNFQKEGVYMRCRKQIVAWGLVVCMVICTVIWHIPEIRVQAEKTNGEEQSFIVDFGEGDVKLKYVCDKTHVKEGDVINISIINESTSTMLDGVETYLEYDVNNFSKDAMSTTLEKWESFFNDELLIWQCYDEGSVYAHPGDIIYTIQFKVTRKFENETIKFKSFNCCSAPDLSLYEDEVHLNSFTFIMNDTSSAESTNATTTHVKDYTEAAEGFYLDYNYTQPASKGAIEIYANGTKNYKSDVLYTDITPCYVYTEEKGKIKTSTSKVVAAVTASDKEPAISKSKITTTKADTDIAKATIKNGQITVTAGKSGGIGYLWVANVTAPDKAKKMISIPVNVKVAPTKIETYNTADKNVTLGTTPKYTAGELQLIGRTYVYLYPYAKVNNANTETIDSISFTATVDKKSKDYIRVEKTNDPFVFLVEGYALKNGKKASGTVTFTCDQSRKKVNFKATVKDMILDFTYQPQDSTKLVKTTADSAMAAYKVIGVSTAAITTKLDVKKRTFFERGRETYGVLPTTDSVYLTKISKDTATALSKNVRDYDDASDGIDVPAKKNGKHDVTADTTKGVTASYSKGVITVKVAKKTAVGTTAYFLLSTNSGYGEIIAVTTAEK